MESEDTYKNQELKLDPKLTKLIKGIHEYKPNLPTKLIKKILNEIGFETQDKNVYKLVAVMADRVMDEIIDSLTQIKYQGIEEKQRIKKIRRNQNEKLISTKDVIQELERIGVNVEDSVPYPMLKATNSQK